MKNEELNEIRKKVQTELNKLKICIICGRDKDITLHHVIHQKIPNPIFNITVPICKRCNEIVHKDNEMMSILRRMWK